MSAPLLELQGISRHFGGLRAVDGVDVALATGEILGVLGPNGAGKTVLFNVICGVYPPTSGAVRLDGRRIDGLPPHRVATLGIGRTFQIVKPFANLTVLDNVLAARGIGRYGRFGAIWHSWRSNAERQAAMELLERVGLADLAPRRAGLLPLGTLRRLEIARALSVGHRLILLDESFSGLRRQEIERIEQLVRSIRRSGIAILLIEHNMRVAMGLCDRLVVLSHGRVISRGTPDEVRRDPAVIEAYLGRTGGDDGAA
jgi:branched-chain amino acid transport system ATP-binding protein